MSQFESARDRLAVALDVDGLDRAQPLIESLGGEPGWLKIGGELFTAAGPPAIAIAAKRAKVFLDTKLHDIPNTVARTVAAATRHGVGMLTLHTCGGAAMLRAARESACEAAGATGRSRPLLVGVTVLTSFSPRTLREVGVAAATVEDHVKRLVAVAIEAGLDGVVTSPHEVQAVRSLAGPGFLIVAPGIRPADWPADDQVRTAGAASAIAAGADLLVVGRPVLAAADPAVAVRRLVAEIERAGGVGEG